MLRIYADFNSCDEQGRVCLNTAGSLATLHAQQDALFDGLRVMLYVPEEFEVEGVLIFDRIWMGIPDWSTLRYCES
jgi:hypothetical protein